MKKFKNFENVTWSNSTIKDYNGVNLEYGDRIVFYNKKSPKYEKTGTIDNIFSSGSCLIKMDYSEDEYYNTSPEYLIKIEYVIDNLTGEMLMIPYENMIDLAELGLINYDKRKKSYFFDDDVRWQIERYML